MMIVRSELTDAANDDLHTHVRTRGELTDTIAELFARMLSDATSNTEPSELNPVLSLQVQVMMARLRLGHHQSGATSSIDPVLLARFRSLRAAIERDFRRCHLVSPIAGQLGCSSKTLNRATRAVVDVSAKQMLAERIVLEAKRLLAHTNESSASIATQLGFDEPTNFVKFFRREAGTTPGSFRATFRKTP